MTDRARRTLAQLVHDDEIFDRAVARAQSQALLRHRLLGQAVAIWRDGRVVIEVPADPRADGA
jgi:hypothetical protein